MMISKTTPSGPTGPSRIEDYQEYLTKWKPLCDLVKRNTKPYVLSVRGYLIQHTRYWYQGKVIAWDKEDLPMYFNDHQFDYVKYPGINTWDIYITRREYK